MGKTAIIDRHVSSSFKENYVPSLGANITGKDYDVDGRYATLMIWDIAAQERFDNVRIKYYTGAKAAVIVYDVTRPATLDIVTFWSDDIKQVVQGNIQMILIANKTDLPAKVESEAGKKLAGKIGADFIETSAKTGENVEGLFESITRKLLATALSPSLKRNRDAN